jgi:hypothetical protein
MKEQGWESMMAARLRLLAASQQQEEAPPHLEVVLRQAYRRRHGVRHAYGPWIAAWGAVAASVLAIVAFVTGPPQRRTPAPPPSVAPPPARLEASPVPALPAPRRAPRPKRYNAAGPARSQREIATDFIPLVYGDALGAEEAHQVVRVRLSRAALVSFGLPLAEEQAASRVQADVVLGGDGMARAIRFVREAP